MGTFNFSSQNVFEIIKLIGNNTHKINLNNYSKVCPTTGFIVFILKDLMEYSGILPDKKMSPVLIYRNFSEIQNKIQETFAHLCKIIN